MPHLGQITIMKSGKVYFLNNKSPLKGCFVLVCFIPFLIFQLFILQPSSLSSLSDILAGMGVARRCGTGSFRCPKMVTNGPPSIDMRTIPLSVNQVYTYVYIARSHTTQHKAHLKPLCCMAVPSHTVCEEYTMKCVRILWCRDDSNMAASSTRRPRGMETYSSEGDRA